MQQKYKTRQREIILSFLRENKDRCFSAKELLEGLKEGDTPLGETTVYRTLNLLSSSGAVKRFSQNDSKSATYQYATQNPACEHHLHLKCRNCDKLYHLECSQLTGLWSHLEEDHGFLVNQADTILYGTCNRCKGEAK